MFMLLAEKVMDSAFGRYSCGGNASVMTQVCEAGLT